MAEPLNPTEPIDEQVEIRPLEIPLADAIAVISDNLKIDSEEINAKIQRSIPIKQLIALVQSGDKDAIEEAGHVYQEWVDDSVPVLEKTLDYSTDYGKILKGVINDIPEAE